ncbi:hypothetical protein AQI88_30145 [Streptomyces cellostaticus]|uniref:Uncharacterized protein n=1 Tax=Streptomyces cellostaticus TaxID=67285 RepID=A0A101NGY1_9ACTN|nr:hypothetical protein [Streptomyces cellostaticus]KUM92819.1 hypothetical protein AQI88_30145 [Streptomyces cellostaticus]GHI06757.1 hypothetical protein Scel_50780 [Streptomyces cellostaticus]
MYDTGWTVGAAALFVHLASLVLGFGAVLVADHHALLCLTGRCTLRDTLHSTARLHVPIHQAPSWAMGSTPVR